MRELKFRAWTRQNPPMPWSQKFVAMTGNGEQMIPIGGAFTGVWHVLGDDAEGLIIEQYTGLKDKNGKEIYEGDIVKEDIDFNSKMTDGTFRYRVYWDECLLCWALDPIGKESIHNELWQTNLSRRVIGNIHENPELLGDTNVTNKEEEK